MATRYCCELHFDAFSDLKRRQVNKREVNTVMPKLKTRSGVKKRFQVKKNGKVKHAKAYGKHLFTFSKSMNRRRRNRGTAFLTPRDAKKVVREMLPYGAR